MPAFVRPPTSDRHSHVCAFGGDTGMAEMTTNGTEESQFSNRLFPARSGQLDVQANR